MSIIAAVNPKGGSGKTTLIITLAQVLSQTGTIAVIDADPNAVIANWAQRRTQAGLPLPFTVTTCSNESTMIRTIDALQKEADIVLIDLEGTASQMITRALARAKLVLVPFNESPVDARLAGSAVELIDREAETFRRPIPFRLVRSRSNATIQSRSATRIINEIRDAELPLLDASLVERAAFRDVFDFDATIYELQEGKTRGVEKAQANAEAVARSVLIELGKELAVA